MNILIRPETQNDYHGIKKINDLAIKQTNEGILIVKLQLSPAFIPELKNIRQNLMM